MYGPLLYREQRTALHFDQILTISFKMSIICWFGSANSFKFEWFFWSTAVITVTYYFKMKSHLSPFFLF